MTVHDLVPREWIRKIVVYRDICGDAVNRCIYHWSEDAEGCDE